MRTYRKAILSALLAFMLVTVTAIASLQTQKHERARTNQQNAQKEIVDNQYPVTDYASELPSDPEKKALRQARNSRYDIKDANFDIQQAKLKEESPSLLLDFPLSHAPVEIALPINQSDAVMIGEVVDAKAYLSNDKTHVYSEFTIRVEEALKQSSLASLETGTSIVAERKGGGVRFSSGKISHRGEIGKNSPLTGRRYLLFLKYNDDVQVYSIITGYELSNGRIVPLDGLAESEGQIPQFENYRKYKGVTETSFLNEVRTALANKEVGRK